MIDIIVGLLVVIIIGGRFFLRRFWIKENISGRKTRLKL